MPPPDDAPALNPKAPTIEAQRSPVRRIAGWSWRLAAVRLRFLAVLGIAFAVVASWDVIRNHWDKLTRAAIGGDPAYRTVSSDTEYFCPMDPGIVADWPGKCPICNMALVRRTRGEVAPLPEGVIARMQASPYRVQLAGIQTVSVGYRPLAIEVEGPGRVIGDGRVELDVFAAEAEAIAEGQEARVAGVAPEPLKATVRAIGPGRAEGERAVQLEVEPMGTTLPTGATVRGCVLVPMATIEPFRALATGPPPLKKGERRRVYGCAEHPEVLRERPGRCPKDDRALDRRDLAEDQRLRWWCPMHPAVTSEVSGGHCAACGGMELVARVVRFGPKGEVLAVPESAVIDTGEHTVVYVERMPGMFDGVEVVLGPRCGDAYPVVRGLEAGERVVATGAFLVDAETRLNPNVAASYFGAARRSGEAAKATSDIDLGESDRARIDLQRTCPVTGKALGSMGTPVRLEVQGRVVFLCCAGCESKLREDPARYLARVPNEPTGPKRAP